MALIKCPECGKDVSSQAVLCPDCGCPINQKSFKKGISKKCILILGTVIILGVIIGSIIFIKIANRNKMEEYYNQALELYKNDELTEAKNTLGNIPNYKGVNELIIKIEERENELKKEQYIENYNKAVDLFQNGNFIQATEILNNLPKNFEVDGETIDLDRNLEMIDIYKQCVTQIKRFSKSLKDPDSLIVKEVFYSAPSEELEKDVVYITYKATNSFGAYVENTACIRDGVYIGEQYKDLGLVEALLAADQSEKLDSTIVQNGLKAY